MNSILRLVPVVLLAFSSFAAADTITGRVVSSTGAPVAGVNIDAIRVSNGNEENNLANDGTNSTGDFVTTIPPGVYDLRFFPPAPPATSHVTLVLRNVSVAGVVNLGTLTLPPGFVLSGHVQTQDGFPISQVTLQVIDGVTGFEVPLALRKTNAFGNFQIAVPRNAIDLRLDASELVTPVVASRQMSLNPVANSNLGNLVLEPGFRVTGHVRRSSNGTSVSGVDLDFTRRATGETVFTPNDNTNTQGNFSIVVPKGSYSIEFCAPFALRLVGARIPRRGISADQDLGVISLAPGFVLSGTIRSFAGAVQANADVDVKLASGGKVNTCNDNTNASGFYSILVPAGDLRVSFHPPSFNLGLSSDLRSVLVSADTTLDGSLPFCAAPVNYGTGLTGTGGIVPHLSSSGGVPADGNSAFAYELSGGRGGAAAILIISLEQRSIPTAGGTLLVNPAPSVAFRIPVTLGGTPGVAGAGSARVELPVSIGLAVGHDVFAQFAVSDPQTPQGEALSEGLRYHVCP